MQLCDIRLIPRDRSKLMGFLAGYKSDENASLAPNAYAQNAK